MKIPSEKEFELLSLVAARERSGRTVARLYQEETGKEISYGTLYTTFRRLREEGWVSSRDDEDEDGRIRFFRITGLGAKALAAGRDHYTKLSRFGVGPKVSPA